jgi:hypothetical protein
VKTIYLKGTSTSTDNDASSALLVTVKRPVGVTQGDLLMAHVKTSPGVHITPPRGWDLVSGDTLLGDQISCFGRTAIATEPERYSWSFTPKDCNIVVEIRAYAGIHTPWFARFQTLLGLNGRLSEPEGDVIDEGQSVVLDEHSVNKTSYARPLMPEMKIKTVSSAAPSDAPAPVNGSSAAAPGASAGTPTS